MYKLQWPQENWVIEVCLRARYCCETKHTLTYTDYKCNGRWPSYETRKVDNLFACLACFCFVFDFVLLILVGAPTHHRSYSAEIWVESINYMENKNVWHTLVSRWTADVLVWIWTVGLLSLPCMTMSPKSCPHWRRRDKHGLLLILPRSVCSTFVFTESVSHTKTITIT